MGTLDVLNVTLDGYSAVLCIVMALYVAITDDRTDKANLCFMGICAANAVMAFGDALSWVWEPPLGGVECTVLKVGTFLFWISPAPMFLCFTGYIVAYLRRRTEIPKGYLRVSVALFALYLIGCVASLGNGMFFSVTPEQGYVRGDFFLWGQVVPVVLHIRNALIIFRWRRHLNAKERLSFSSYIALPLIAEVFQVPFYGIALMNTAVALATIVVFMNIQATHRAELAERDRELAEARGDIMLSQIQPHFLYNTLTAIRELCLTDSVQAADMVTRFSRFLRENMASLTSKNPIPIDRELKHVETYLDLERRRFGDRLQVEYDIRARGFSCPPLVVQPLVENAVRHGVTRRVEGGCVTISTRELPCAFEVVVSDDGVGFDVAAQSGDALGAPAFAPGPNGRAHVGIRNVSMRLREVCGGDLEVTSTPGEGTVARIIIPKTEEEA